MSDSDHAVDANGHSFRFLGMTKVQFLGALVVLLAAACGVAFVMFGLAVKANTQVNHDLQDAQSRIEANQKRISAIAADNHAIFCAQKNNQIVQIAVTTQFLKDNPGPFPLANVPRATLEQGLARSTAFLHTFDRLQNCPAPDLP